MCKRGKQRSVFSIDPKEATMDCSACTDGGEVDKACVAIASFVRRRRRPSPEIHDAQLHTDAAKARDEVGVQGASGILTTSLDILCVSIMCGGGATNRFVWMLQSVQSVELLFEA